jgi:hypothetical protein
MGRVLSWLRARAWDLLELILPFFRSPRARSGLGAGLRIVLHVAVVVLIVVVLFWLNNQVLKLAPDIPIRPRFLARVWLPILFLLLYALCWLSWWLWKLLVHDEESDEFRDVDQAWEEALAALRAARLSLTDLPLFLVLGRPEDEEKALFQAAQLSLEVKQAPARPEAPLHLYASRDAIYVTCAGSSLLGAYALSLAGKSLEASDERNAGPGHSPGAEDEDEVLKTLTPGAAGGTLDPKFGAVQDMVAVLQKAQREGRPLSKVDKRELRRIYRRDNPHRSLVRNSERMDRQTARLRHLCRLFVRDRHPYCAVNGILLLVPFAGTDSDDDASHAGQVCQRDLAVATTALEVHCPLFALVGDLETAPGFTEFVQRFSSRERLQRLGRSCPLLPDFAGPREQAAANGQAGRMVRSLVSWLCQSVAQMFVYRKFQLEKAGPEEPVNVVVRNNSRLFLLFDELQQRSQRLGLILANAIEAKGPGPLLFGGCYLGGTGTDAPQEQAFVKGVFDRLIEGQSCVYWTEQAKNEEARYRRWVYTGWTVLAVGVVVALAVVGYVSLG